MRAYLASDEARRLAGESTSMRISVQTTSRTANCQLVIKLYDTAGPLRPTGLSPGYAATFTSSAITTDFPLPVQINGPYCHNVDIVLEVSASSGSVEQVFQGTITVTLFFD
ncbi:hypothetical protein L6R53_29680 [Myxococcota bacterium]|nr:hypothetical protein [Myxococcota bacterium]